LSAPASTCSSSSVSEHERQIGHNGLGCTRGLQLAGRHLEALDGVPKEAPMAIDPVCKMQVDENKAAGKSEYNGKTYFFCAASCKTKFDRDPKQYAK
jgi:YHS domain-containing protein